MIIVRDRLDWRERRGTRNQALRVALLREVGERSQHPAEGSYLFCLAGFWDEGLSGPFSEILLNAFPIADPILGISFSTFWPRSSVLVQGRRR